MVWDVEAPLLSNLQNKNAKAPWKFVPLAVIFLAGLAVLEYGRHISEVSLASQYDFGEDGLTDAQRRILESYSYDPIYQQDVRFSMLESNDELKEAAVSTFYKETPVAAKNGKIVFYYFLVSPSMSTWGDFNPYKNLALGLGMAMQTEKYSGTEMHFYINYFGESVPIGSAALGVTAEYGIIIDDNGFVTGFIPNSEADIKAPLGMIGMQMTKIGDAKNACDTKWTKTLYDQKISDGGTAFVIIEGYTTISFARKFYNKLKQELNGVLKVAGVETEGNEDGKPTQTTKWAAKRITIYMGPTFPEKDNKNRYRHAKPLWEKYGKDAYWVTNCGACGVKTDLGIVAGDLTFKAKNIFFGRAEYLFEDYGQGPGGWTSGADARPEHYPIYNSGPLLPGIQTSTDRSEALPEGLTQFLGVNPDKLVFCILGSSAPSLGQGAINLIIGKLQDALDNLIAKRQDWIMIIQGLKTWMQVKADGKAWTSSVYEARGYVPYVLLAPKCHVWMNQFGAGSMFWGAVNAKPLMYNVFDGQGAADKGYLKQRAQRVGVCTNCGGLPGFKPSDDLKTKADGAATLANQMHLALEYYNETSADGLRNTGELSERLLHDWATKEEIQTYKTSKTPMTNSRSDILTHDSASMKYLPLFVLDAAINTPNADYKLLPLPANGKEKRKYPAEKAKAVVFKHLPNDPHQTCVLVLQSSNCQYTVWNSIDSTKDYVKAVDVASVKGCGMFSQSSCSLCCIVEPSQPQDPEPEVETQPVMDGASQKEVKGAKDELEKPKSKRTERD